MKRAIVTIFVLAGFLQISAQNILYVKKGANGNGTSWAQAYGDLQQALQAAKPNTEIWVAKGVYTPTVTGNRSVSFVINEGITLLGGFSGTEHAKQLRNVQQNPTTLSGNIGDPASSHDNSFNVVYTRNVSNVVVDGFIICDGTAINEEQPVEGNRNSTGAAWYNEATQGNHKVRISNCVFQYNKSNYGAGMYNIALNGAVNASEIVNCQFIENNAQVEGGAVMNVGNGGTCQVKIEKCNLNNNFALYGGAIFLRAINNGVNSCITQSNNLQDNKAYIDGADFFTNRDNMGLLKPLFMNNVSTNAPSSSNILNEEKLTPNTISRMKASNSSRH